MATDPSSVPRTLSLGPLDDDDVTDLLAAFERAGIDDVVIGANPAGHFRLGEPTTIAAIVMVSTSAIGALTAFLLKRRKRSSVEYSLSVDYADGTSIRESLRLEASDSSPPDPELVQKLAELTGIDSQDISELID